jgi:hypothetical protein
MIGTEAFGSSDKLHTYMEQGKRTVGERAFPQNTKITFLNGEKNFTVTLTDDMTCEHSDSENALLEFAANPSDEAFRAIKKQDYKLPAAICFSENIRAAICFAVDSADSDLMSKLLNMDFANSEDISYCINHAIENKHTEQQAVLMRFKHEKFGKEDVGKIVDDKFRL